MNQAARIAILIAAVAVGACKEKSRPEEKAHSGPTNPKAAPGAAPAATEGRGEPRAAEPKDPGSKTSVNGGTPVQRTVLPSATDPAIHEPNEPHLVFVPSGAKNGKLVVYLPGTNGKAASSTMFLTTAAHEGYHGISLTYPDSEPATVCKSDLDCFETFRRKIWDGSNVNDKAEVTATESIKNRLIKLLTHLDTQFPNEGWKAYLSGNDLAYSSIAFAGHSQGGGFAAYIGKHHEVARVLMFASVVDASDANPPVPAHWVSSSHATPIERYYGFDHVKDKFAAKIAVDWVALGLDKLGPRFSVDGQKAPFGNSHQLTTSIAEPDGQRAHTSVVPDHGTPVNDGVPLFQDVWRYMLTH